jgi:hypothetical protein
MNTGRRVAGRLCAVLGLLLPGPVAAAMPPGAAAADYTVNTFSSTFDTSQVDMANSTKSGYKWYISRHAASVTPQSSVLLNNDGSVTLEYTSASNDGMATAGMVKGGWIGTVFGGGGYFEATLKFDPDMVTNRAKGFPAWWSIAIEHFARSVTGQTSQWPGQPPGFEHYIEPDFFEWNIDGVDKVPPKTYNGSMIDWSGIWTRAHGMPVSKQTPWTTKWNTTPSTTDFRQYHKYGWLWVPATATTKGYAQYYFDDQPTTDRVSWTQYTNQEPTPAQQMDPWTFGILDQQHLMLILGSGDRGAMTVESVTVWQKSDRYNGKDGVIPPFDAQNATARAPS